MHHKKISGNKNDNINKSEASQIRLQDKGTLTNIEGNELIMKNYLEFGYISKNYLNTG